MELGGVEDDWSGRRRKRGHGDLARRRTMSAGAGPCWRPRGRDGSEEADGAPAWIPGSKEEGG